MQLQFANAVRDGQVIRSAGFLAFRRMEDAGGIELLLQEDGKLSVKGISPERAVELAHQLLSLMLECRLSQTRVAATRAVDRPVYEMVVRLPRPTEPIRYFELEKDALQKAGLTDADVVYLTWDSDPVTRDILAKIISRKPRSASNG